MPNAKLQSFIAYIYTKLQVSIPLIQNICWDIYFLIELKSYKYKDTGWLEF